MNENNLNDHRLDRIEKILEEVTVRLDRLARRQMRFEKQTNKNITELIKGQATMTQAIRHIVETQGMLTAIQSRQEEKINELKEIQNSLAAGQERQERLLDYCIRRFGELDQDNQNNE